MNTLLIFLAVMAALHLVYEGILLPSIRIYLRNRLFELRDEIRALKISGLEKEDEKAFWFVHDGINAFLTRLPQMTLHRMVKILMEYDANPKLKEETHARLKVVTECSNQDIVRIFNKTNNILEWAFMSNMMGWFFYVLPIVVAISYISKLSQFINNLLLTPSNPAHRMFGEQRTV